MKQSYSPPAAAVSVVLRRLTSHELTGHCLQLLIKILAAPRVEKRKKPPCIAVAFAHRKSKYLKSYLHS